MTGERWVKVVDEIGGVRDIEYEYRSSDGARVGRVWRSGVRGYPWAWVAQGRRGESVGLASAKAAVEKAAVCPNCGTVEHWRASCGLMGGIA